MRRLILILFTITVVVIGVLVGCIEQPGQHEYEEALAEYRAGNYVRAKALMENAINRNPGSRLTAEAYNWLGMINWNLELFNEAMDAFSDAIRIDDSYVTPTYNLALLMYKSGDLEQAEQLLRQATLVDGKDTRALEYLAGIMMEQQDWPEARKKLYEALDRDQESPRILTALALVELNSDGPDAAIRYLTQALEKNATYPPALYNIATIQRDYFGNGDEAKAYYRMFLEQEANGPYVHQARRALMERMPVRRPTMTPTPTATPTPLPTPTMTPTPKPTFTPAPTATPIPAATPTATPVPTATPTPEPTPKPTATPVREPLPAYDALITEAKDLVAKGDTEKALKPYIQAAKVARNNNRIDLFEQALQQAVKDCFDQYPAHFAYGKYLSSKGEHDAALKSMKQAAVLKPQSVNIQKSLAEAAMNAEEYDTALIGWKKVIGLEQRNPDAHWAIAEIYNETGADLKAMQGYQDFIRMFPEDPRTVKARKQLGVLRDKRNAPKEKKIFKRRTVKITRDQQIQSVDNTPAVIPTPVPTTTVSDKPEESEKERQLRFKKTVVRKKRSAIQAYNRGTLYQNRGDNDRAIYYYKRAIENDDTFAAAFYNLGSVYRAVGDLDLAKDAYLHAIRLQDNMVDARYNLSLLYYELQQFPAAEQHASRIVEQNPDHANAHMLLGLIYADNPRKRDKAIYHYTEYLRLEPNSPNGRDIRRWLREQAAQ